MDFYNQVKIECNIFIIYKLRNNIPHFIVIIIKYNLWVKFIFCFQSNNEKYYLFLLQLG